MFLIHEKEEITTGCIVASSVYHEKPGNRWQKRAAPEKERRVFFALELLKFRKHT